MIIDASVVLSGFFPDEEGQAEAQALIRAHVQQEVELLGPALPTNEVVNAILQAVRRDRIDLEKGQEILTAFQGLGIPVADVPWDRVLELARTYDRSAYDGAYLAFAEQTRSRLITGDRHLYNAVRDHLPWVLWIGQSSVTLRDDR